MRNNIDEVSESDDNVTFTAARPINDGNSESESDNSPLIHHPDQEKGEKCAENAKNMFPRHTHVFLFVLFIHAIFIFLLLSFLLIFVIRNRWKIPKSTTHSWFHGISRLRECLCDASEFERGNCSDG